MSAAVLLMALVILAHFGPELLSLAVGGTVAAWDYCLQGAQAAALWLCVAALSGGWLVRAIAAWGAFEAAQRPICRAMFPMDQPVRLPAGVNLCEAAFGSYVGWAGAVVALFVALLTQEAQRAERGR